MDDELDDWLPLTVARARQFRALVQTAFRARALTVSMQQDTAVHDETDEVFRLWDLAAMCSHVGEEEWPEIIGETVFTMLEAPRTLLATLSENQLRAKVYHRLAAVTEPPDLAGYPTARRIGDDLIAVVSVHHQRFTDTPLESSWEEFGGVDRWRELGTQNLRNLLASGAIEHDHFRLEDGSDFHMATGDARFASSVALVLDEVISRFEYVGTRTDRGVLVAVPFRHQLAWKVVDGPGAALSLNAMFQWAQMCFADSVGPLTPHVFWVRGDDWRQVTRIDDGQPRVIVEADLNDALGMPPDWTPG